MCEFHGAWANALQCGTDAPPAPNAGTFAVVNLSTNSFRRARGQSVMVSHGLAHNYTPKEMIRFDRSMPSPSDIQKKVRLRPNLCKTCTNRLCIVLCPRQRLIAECCRPCLVRWLVVVVGDGKYWTRIPRAHVASEKARHRTTAYQGIPTVAHISIFLDIGHV